MPKTWCCPYWKWEDGLRVHCEAAKLTFSSADEREAYINRYCAAVPGWADCTIAKFINSKYERGKTNVKEKR